MSETHELTDKEIKAIDNAVSVVKKFAKYIKSINLDNHWLRKNLDESIKAGDVTNAQKVDLRAISNAERCFTESHESLKEECRRSNCPIGLDHKQPCPDSCALKQKLIILDWMRSAFRGNQMEWKWILDYALVGRKLWMDQHHHTTFARDMKLWR